MKRLTEPFKVQYRNFTSKSVRKHK